MKTRRVRVARQADWRAETPMKGVQVFTDEYLEQCRKLTPDAIVRFLDDFRRIHGGKRKSRLSRRSRS